MKKNKNYLSNQSSKPKDNLKFKIFILGLILNLVTFLSFPIYQAHAVGYCVATGGTVTTSGAYTIHTFSGDGTFSVSSGCDVEYLVVGGGGGGGGSTGGGGGGGGLLTGTLAVTAQAYPITVGQGGNGGTTAAIATNGQNSSFSTINASGGGRGGNNQPGPQSNANGDTGGSGGGASYVSSAGTKGSGTPGQGYDGGSNLPNGWPSGHLYSPGGGGGAGAVGANGADSGSTGAAGGDGVQSCISGSCVYYAGGGGGGLYYISEPTPGTPGSGGSGGGGTGGNGPTGARVDATAGTDGLGGGGGGQGGNVATAAGNGGSGIVIIRYLTTTGELQSANYKIQNYGFGAGGTGEGGITGASNYTIFGTAGEIDTGKLSGASLYSIGAGLTFTLKANVSAAPSFTNPSQNYDRLKFIIDDGGNPTDATFAIAISTDNFASDVRYIQNDNTIGVTLGSEDWQNYTDWGDATGEYVTGLVANTTYYIKVKAEQGNFTESEYSEVANATTSNPSLTFGIDSATLTFNHLNSGNSFTDSSKSTILTTSTNAYNGYIVYGRVTQPLTFSTFNIANYASPNSAPSTWTGTGFGYNTDDTDLSGGTANRFSGSKYAGFTTSAPGDPVADHTGPVLSAISNENFTIAYRVTADQNTAAGDYTTTVLYIVVPEY